ncbi:hypothetical protein [Rheinheimera maricola]|uniref:Uncharacterized protein n=1 Tax=Rheinheimera maricola TaxID=2793282 RepID=A0ABS7X6V2_9GAMM|nr:hypothetical protein [Rheinheimera maricola]MBZ9610845.1 hypothetical protein [Rheinheimera maricola]
MKKPQPIQGEYVPRNRTAEPTKSTSETKPDTGPAILNDMLGKLDGAQVQQIFTSLASGLVELGSNALNYGKEREITKRVYAQAEADIKKYASDVARTKEEEKTKRKELKVNGDNNRNKHLENMISETNSHVQVMAILRQVESGAISPQDLVSLIHLVKTKEA